MTNTNQNEVRLISFKFLPKTFKCDYKKPNAILIEKCKTLTKNACKKSLVKNKKTRVKIVLLRFNFKCFESFD